MEERRPLLEDSQELLPPTREPSVAPSAVPSSELGPPAGQSASSYSWWAYYIPSLKWLPEYKLEYAIGDLCGALSVACYNIPLCISYATNVARTPATSGLYGTIVPPIVYALLGSVPTLVIGPEGPLSLVLGEVMTPYLHHDHPHPRHNDRNYDMPADQVVGVISGTAGAILLLTGLFRFGFLDSVLSRSLLKGFISGVGAVMVVDQFPTLLGLQDMMHKVTGTHPTTWGKLAFLVEHASEAHKPTAILSLVAVFSLFAMRKFKAVQVVRGHPWFVFLPDVLVVVVLSTVFCGAYNWHKMYDISIVGKIKPEQLLQMTFPFTPTKLIDIKTNFSSSFFIALLGLFETIIAAKAMTSLHESTFSTNRELVALGAANLCGSLVGALPSMGGYARSKVNTMAGARTQMSSIFMASLSIISLIFLMDLFHYLPTAVMSSILVVIATTLIQEAPPEIAFFIKLQSTSDMFVLAITFLFTLFVSVETGIAVGAGASVIRVIRHATKSRIQILGRDPHTNTFHNADTSKVDLESISGCLIVKIPEPLTFANTGDLKNRLRRLETCGSDNSRHQAVSVHVEPIPSNELKVVIIDMHGMTKCDTSAVQILCDLVEGYLKRNVQVIMTRIPKYDDVSAKFRNSGLDDLLLRQRVQPYFGSVQDALDYLDARNSRV